MSIRKLANHGFQRGGFSLHNILSGNEDVNIGEVGGPLKGNDRLFDFSGRISDASPIDAESPNAQIRLKVPLKLHTSMSQSTTTPTNAPSEGGMGLVQLVVHERVLDPQAMCSLCCALHSDKYGKKSYIVPLLEYMSFFTY